MDIFATAKAVAPAKTAAKKTKDEIQMPGLKTVAMVDALIKTLGTLQGTLTKEVKDTAAVIFHEQACDTGRVPVSFRGIDGDASGSIECRKRGTNSPLQPDEVELLEKHGLTVEEAVIVPEMYGFDNELIKDPKVMATIQALLGPAMATGKLPAGLIVKQEKVSKKVVTDATLETACRMKTKLPAEVLGTLTSLAIKPKLEVTDLPTILAEVTALLVPADTDAEEVVVGATVIKA